jgi:uncharacterized membrane protein required for colicin V production
VVSLNIIFWMYVILFAIIGAMRGWAKELMVTFSIILALFLINVLQTYVGIVDRTLRSAGAQPTFWFRATIVILLTFFGYQTPNIRAIAGARFARERLQDTLLGFLIGAFNGYLVVGTLVYYMHTTNYPFPDVISPPTGAAAEAITRMMTWLPPEWLTIPWIYFAVGLAFLFVIVVFI